MVLKNFFFRENWVGSEVADMKVAFFAILDPCFGPPKVPNMKFVKQSFNFQSLRTTEALLLLSM